MNEKHANADQIAFWNAQAGETWARRQMQLDRQLDSLGRLAMAALAPSAGERIVDIGCGCGQTTLELADMVGQNGAVTGVDVSAPMLTVARERALGEGPKQVRFMEADAQVHRFEPGAFDAAFSRFGVMFFADPIAAFANIAAALAPGGRLAFVCWRDMALNPFMTVPLRAALPLLTSPPPELDPTSPGPFAFADADRVRTVLSGAGFADISLAPHDEAVGGGSLDEAASLALTIGPLGAILRERPDLAEPVRGAVREALEPHLTAAGVFVASASWIVTARKPPPNQRTSP